MKQYLLSILIFLFSLPLSAQIIFDYHFPDSASSEVTSLKTTPEGYVISGSQLLHVDKNGHMLMQVPQDHNRAHSIPADSGFVLGWSTNFSQRNAATGHIARYDKDGNQLWETLITLGHWRNFVEEVVPLNDGSFIYTGRHQAVTGSGAVIRKLDSAGNVLWESKWSAGSTISSYGQQIFPKDSNFYVIGKANASYDGQGVNRDLFVSRHKGSEGRREMTYLYQSDSTDDVEDLLLIENQRLLLLANSNGDTTSTGFRGLLISLTDTSSWVPTENWVKHYPSAISEQFRAIERTSDNGYLILGTRGEKEIDSVKTFLLKVDINGDKEWEYLFSNKTYHHIGIDMEHEDSSIYVIAGHTEDVSGDRDYFLTKVDVSHLRDSVSVGLEEYESLPASLIKLSPNPATDVLHITCTDTDLPIKEIRILTLQGQVIDYLTSHSTHIFYPCESLPKGVYLLEARVGKSRVTQRFIVQ